MSPTRDQDRSVGNLCELLRSFPDIVIVLMHVDYQCRHEVLAIAKHCGNALIDICSARIFGSLTSVLSLKRPIITAAAKILPSFGGDYVAVETTCRHRKLARRTERGRATA